MIGTNRRTAAGSLRKWWYSKRQSLAELNNEHLLLWRQAVNDALPHSCVPVLATDPLYIALHIRHLGKPKGVVRDNVGWSCGCDEVLDEYYLRYAARWCIWAASDVGWVVGHSTTLFASLIHGCTTILFEGKPVRTPDQAHSGTCVLKSTTSMYCFLHEKQRLGPIKKGRSWKASCSPSMTYHRSSRFSWRRTLRRQHWIRLGVSCTNKPVIDHWWQTETGWAISCKSYRVRVVPVKAGSSTKPVPGYRKWKILNEKAR
ncbi:AMP-binding protein [Vibrio lentus]|nr:AMP-binding protein [Vibrio lentus]